MSLQLYTKQFPLGGGEKNSKTSPATLTLLVNEKKTKQNKKTPHWCRSERLRYNLTTAHALPQHSDNWRELITLSFPLRSNGFENHMQHYNFEDFTLRNEPPEHLALKAHRDCIHKIQEAIGNTETVLKRLAQAHPPQGPVPEAADFLEKRLICLSWSTGLRGTLLTEHTSKGQIILSRDPEGRNYFHALPLPCIIYLW